jgi:restriction endonuclease Mrr
MPVPSLYTFCRPILELAPPGEILVVADARTRVADALDLSEEDRHETAESGLSGRLRNRFNFAKERLLKARWISAVDRGRFRITDAGKAALELPPSVFDAKVRAAAKR